MHCPRHAERMAANPANRAPVSVSPLIVDRYLRNREGSQIRKRSAILPPDQRRRRLSPDPSGPLATLTAPRADLAYLIRIRRKLTRRIRPTRRKWTPRGYRILRTGHILHAIPGNHVSGFPWLPRTPPASPRKAARRHRGIFTPGKGTGLTSRNVSQSGRLATEAAIRLWTHAQGMRPFPGHTPGNGRALNIPHPATTPCHRWDPPLSGGNRPQSRKTDPGRGASLRVRRRGGRPSSRQASMSFVPGGRPGRCRPWESSKLSAHAEAAGRPPYAVARVAGDVRGGGQRSAD